MKAVNVGLLGAGTVGGGALAVLRRNAGEISRRAGRAIRITRAAVSDPGKPRAGIGDLKLTDDALAIADDPDIDIVLELIGGDGVAKDAVLRAIDNRKHIVTANKALIALHGNAIFERAQAKGVTVAFEAAVAGGIPIIKSLREGLAANRIESLAGIINGTCNYILTRMQDGGGDFADALAAAQRLGYAEADPATDLGGVDAAHKLTILASIAFGIPLQFERAHVQGIADIAPEDIEYARELGYRIKHLGIARRAAAGIELRAHPALVAKRELIANVDGVLNAILVQADALGPSWYCGAGAGAEPTASAVVADLVDVVRAITTDPQNRVPHLAFQPGSLAELPILPIADIETAYYLRLRVLNRPGVLASIARIFGDSGISIDTILQKGPGRPNEEVTVIILTQTTIERDMNAALDAIAELDTMRGPIARIRLEKLS